MKQMENIFWWESDFKEFTFKWLMINLPALFNLTKSRTLRLYAWHITLSVLASIMPFTPSLTFIELSYLRRNFLSCLGYNKNCQGTINFYLKPSFFW